MFKKSALTLASVSVGIALNLGATKPAQAINFSFSFSNTVGNVTGTVTGRIIGLDDNTSSSAQHIFIDNSPSDRFGTLPPFDAVSFAVIENNSFTVSGGRIVDGIFSGRNRGIDTFFGLDLNSLNPQSEKRLNSLKNIIDAGIIRNYIVSNDEGLAGLNLQPLNSTSVPEPKGGAMEALTTLAIGGIVLKKKLARSAKSQRQV